MQPSPSPSHREAGRQGAECRRGGGVLWAVQPTRQRQVGAQQPLGLQRGRACSACSARRNCTVPFHVSYKPVRMNGPPPKTRTPTSGLPASSSSSTSERRAASTRRHRTGSAAGGRTEKAAVVEDAEVTDVKE